MTREVKLGAQDVVKISHCEKYRKYAEKGRPGTPLTKLRVREIPRLLPPSLSQLTKDRGVTVRFAKRVCKESCIFNTA